MVAEAAHSWADTGNEVFLLVAERRGARKRDSAHPLGYGRETYIWSMFAAFGLFTAGAIVSIYHGISELGDTGPAEDVVVNYVVLAVSFVLEGTSFLQAYRHFDRARRESDGRPLRPWVIRIAHNLASNYYRDRSRRPQTPLENAAPIATRHDTEAIAEGRDTYGMQSFNQSAIEWYQKGMVSYEEARRTATSQTDFEVEVERLSMAQDVATRKPGSPVPGRR